MAAEQFIDYYDLLAVSSNSNAELVETAVRAQLRRYSPRNTGTADAVKFELVKTAYLALSNAKSRSTYDAEYKRRNGRIQPAAQKSVSTNAMQGEVRKRHVVLTVLYERMLTKPQDGAMTGMEISSGVELEFESLEFPLWFLREKGHIARTGVGDLRITAKGVEWLEEAHGICPAAAVSEPPNPNSNESTTASGDEPVAGDAVSLSLLSASEGVVSH